MVSGEFAKKQREEIVRALTESKGRVGGADGAAARLGINRTTLLARIKKFGIDPQTVCLSSTASSVTRRHRVKPSSDRSSSQLKP